MKIFAIVVLSIVSFLFGSPLVKGEKAPDFLLIDEKGENHSLSALLNRQPVLLIFYPGDNTPVCTKQLCELRDNYDTLQSLDSVAVFGINNDSQESHKNFSKEHKYPFPLLIDKDWAIAGKYGVKGGIMGVKRWVFIIDKNGIIQFAKKGKPPVEELLEVLGHLDDNLK